MDFMVCPPDRKKIITKNLNLYGIGVEVGPILRVVLQKKEYNVFYADYASADVLRQEYANNKLVDVTRIPQIDYVIGEKYIDEVAGRDKFDYIIASHVIEHVPDFIGWIAACLRAMKPGGILSLAIPNANYTFDVVRRRTIFTDVLAAYVEGRRKPTINQVADHFGNVVHASAKDTWGGVISADNAKRLYKDKYVLNLCKQVYQTGKYKNCHCWVFDEETFKTLIDRAIALSLLSCEILSLTPTRFNEGEFFCSLRRVD